MFVGSSQDGFSQLETSCVQLSDRIKDKKLYKAMEVMQEKILGQLEKSRVIRLRFNFEIKGNFIDTNTGRKAHIEFIENLNVVKFIVFGYDLFKKDKSDHTCC